MLDKIWAAFFLLAFLAALVQAIFLGNLEGFQVAVSIIPWVGLAARVP